MQDSSNNIKQTEVEYSTLYNDKFRPITNEQIITVEISPTGSGKTYFYRNEKNTIMLFPTNALVRENGGLFSKTKAKDKDRTEWFELYEDKCDYMTYDKFAGHIKHENISKKIYIKS